MSKKELIRFMASFCYNCCTDMSYEERVVGNEEQILADFKAGIPGWESAALIQEPHTRNSKRVI